MALNMYEITFHTLTGAGLAVSRARDLMSKLTLLRIDGAVYTANFAASGPALDDGRTALTIDIQCDVEPLAEACVHLAPHWIECTAPEKRSGNTPSGDACELFFVSWTISLTQ